MLTEEQIVSNFERFKELLKKSNRDGIDSLIRYLDDKTDFAIAPASTKYHENYKGGLCEHCLAVYDNLEKLIDEFAPNEIKEDSIIVVSLLHDLAKVNFYEEYDKNVKVNGQWVQEKHYKIRDLENRFIYGSHEETSLFIAQQFIPLSIEEQVSIIVHHGGLGTQNASVEVVSDVYNAYKLPIYLHIADLIDAFKK